MRAFIQEVWIKKVRHLEDKRIFLSDKERKHLILTGKNGSGKTSVLEAIRDFLKVFGVLTLAQLNESKDRIVFWKKHIQALTDKYKKGSMPELEKINLNKFQEALKKDIRNTHRYSGAVESVFTSLADTDALYASNTLLLAYFSASRLDRLKAPKTLNPVKIPDKIKLEDKLHTQFIAYLIREDFKRLQAARKGDKQVEEAIDAWFENFRRIVGLIYEDDALKIEADIDNFNYWVYTKGRNPFYINEMSDGYTALFHIVFELLIRIEGKGRSVKEMEGVVLVDEIDTHLHPSLQKQVLPFLTTLFPRLQFIVTTHSPFILNSIDNAVVYDLQNDIRLDENLMGVSYSGIMEGYFEVTAHSQEVYRKLDRYKELLTKELELGERQELEVLRGYFKELNTIEFNGHPTFSAQIRLELRKLERMYQRLKKS